MLSCVGVHPLASRFSEPLDAVAGGITASSAMVRVVPSSNSKVMAPRVAPGERREKSGWMLICVGCPGTIVVLDGALLNQVPTPGSVIAAELNNADLALGFEIITACASGFGFFGPAKMRPLGRTSGPGLVPRGSTVRTTEIVWSKLSNPGDVTWICP